MAGIDAVAGSLGLQQMSGGTLKSESKDNLSLEFDDYLQIIVAQLQNQDMTNPTDTSDFINQMVQYTTIQVMQEMNTLSTSSYAMSFIGKDVVIAETDTTGNITTKEGVVEGVSLYYDEPVFIVDGKEYPMSSIMIAGNLKKAEEAPSEKVTQDVVEEASEKAAEEVVEKTIEDVEETTEEAIEEVAGTTTDGAIEE